MKNSHPFPPRLLPACVDLRDSVLCPIRSASDDDPNHCWGSRCAAFLAVDANHGTCALIERTAQ